MCDTLATCVIFSFAIISIRYIIVIINTVTSKCLIKKVKRIKAWTHDSHKTWTFVAHVLPYKHCGHMRHKPADDILTTK